MKKYKLCFILLICNAVVFILTLPRVCATFYAERVFPVLENIFARVFGLFPFSVGELLLFAALPLWLIIYLRHPLVRFRQMFIVILCAAMTFQLGCGINYRRVPLIYYYTAAPVPYEREDVVKLIHLLSRYAEENVGADSYSNAAVRDAAREYLRGIYVPNPKPLLTSPLYCRLNISGVYSPFTYEANINSMVPSDEKPFVTAHELSHLSGFMREDEANFTAFQICGGSDDRFVRYSGYVSGLVYALNECYYMSATEELFEDYHNIVLSLPAPVLKSLRERDEFWGRYQSPLANVSLFVNNLYIRANGEDSGVESYNEVVDLLIQKYKKFM